MDVEFGVMHSDLGLSSTTSAQPNEDVPSWQRISSRANNESVSRVEASTSQTSSTVHSFRKALNAAILNASTAAKTVFSPAYRQFRFKDFCPKLFAKVRTMVGIDVEDYSRSFQTTCRESFSEGRSNAFMFYSSDQKCIVKTITKEDLDTLREILPAYVQYLEESPSSLIVRFLGAHCITMYGVELYFVVMLNMFPTSNLSERYDLKGSWVNRHGFSGTRRSTLDRSGQGGSLNPPLFQDNDLQQKISLSREVGEAVTKQIYDDVTFLKSR
jgi:1-phosphatidylinositol-4-phosphate 5-kinase